MSLSDIFRRDKLKEQFEKTGLVAEKTITSAEIKALNTTPITVVEDKAGHVLEFVSAIVIFDYGTVQYTSGGSVEFREETSGTVLTGDVILASTIQAAADSISRLESTQDVTTLTEGKGIQIAAQTADFATGDGVIRVKVSYKIHKTDL